MNRAKENLDTCGCCTGIQKSTPEILKNDHGLEHLLYRVGRHSSFQDSMISGFSENAFLQELTAHEDNDSTSALIDVWSMILDILTFYNERIINEGYILTAKERLSLVELARHISYIPKPGVAAGTWLSILTEESPGAPLESRVMKGTKVQSTPGQDEKAQIFETIEEIIAHTKWNLIKPKLTKVQPFGKGLTHLYLEGSALQLDIGDKILLVGKHRIENPLSERWDFRTITKVEIDNDQNKTKISWREGLGHENPNVMPAHETKLYVFRQKAALFGHNAPDFRTMAKDVKISFNGPKGNEDAEWKNGFKNGNTVDDTVFLDADYPKILKESWLVFVRPAYVELYKAKNVKADAQSNFGVVSKSSKIKLDTKKNLETFERRDTTIWAQSEELTIAESPIISPVFGTTITLSSEDLELTAGQKMIVTGEVVTHLQVTSRKTVIKKSFYEETIIDRIYFMANSGSWRELQEGDILEVTARPEIINSYTVKYIVKFENQKGYVIATDGDLIPYIESKTSDRVELPSALNQVKWVSELVETEKIEGERIRLVAPLENVYFRNSLTINANVAQATHGESKTEILGSGNGSIPFQKFYLKQKPLTYISSSSPSGIESSLEVRVDDIRWKAVSTFYQTKPDDRVYITRTEDDGTVYIQFGNGITGARLSTGVENVIAQYRVGIGLEGILQPQQLSLLLTPQLGVKSLSNPLATTGAENPEAIDMIRYNAPLTVLTLDRIVSISDYEDFANAFAGIGKARADLLWKGEDRTVHLTVASANEDEISPTLRNHLSNAIDNARHDNYPVVINSFKKIHFAVKVKIKVNENYLFNKVKDEVKMALIEQYSFASRSFGQVVTPSEIITVIQSVEGIEAVDLDRLGGKKPFSKPHFRLISNIARWETDTILPAELLLIDQDNIHIALFN